MRMFVGLEAPAAREWTGPDAVMSLGRGLYRRSGAAKSGLMVAFSWRSLTVAFKLKATVSP